MFLCWERENKRGSVSGNQTWQLKTQHLLVMFPFKPPFIEFPVPSLSTGRIRAPRDHGARNRHHGSSQSGQWGSLQSASSLKRPKGNKELEWKCELMSLPSVHEHKTGMMKLIALFMFKTICNCTWGIAGRTEPVATWLLIMKWRVIAGNPHWNGNGQTLKSSLWGSLRSLTSCLCHSCLLHLLRNPCRPFLPCRPWLSGSHLHRNLQAELGDHLALCPEHHCLLREAPQRGAEGLRPSPHWPRRHWPRHWPRRHWCLARRRCLHPPRDRLGGSIGEPRLELLSLRHGHWVCPTAFAREPPSPEREQAASRPSGVMQVGWLIGSWDILSQEPANSPDWTSCQAETQAWLYYQLSLRVTVHHCPTVWCASYKHSLLPVFLDGYTATRFMLLTHWYLNSLVYTHVYMYVYIYTHIATENYLVS